MLALGETLADFFEEDVGPIDFGTLRTTFLQPVLALSRTLPVFRRAETWAATGAETAELHRIILEGRSTGFDIPTLLLDDFYQRGAGAASLRSRASALVRILYDEVQRQGGSEQQPVQVLVLGANSVLALGAALAGHDSPGPLSILIVDSDTQALRRARQSVEDTLGIRPAVLRATPFTLAAHPSRPTEPFDIVYTLTPGTTGCRRKRQWDLTQDIVSFLQPGGALLTGRLPAKSPAQLSGARHGVCRDAVDLLG